MGLRILGSTDGDEVAGRLRDAIREALPGAEIEVTPGSPGHFAVRVVSDAFAGQPRVKQQQLVYAAIAPLMKGEAPPVHAIDRMETIAPEAT